MIDIQQNDIVSRPFDFDEVVLLEAHLASIYRLRSNPNVRQPSSVIEQPTSLGLFLASDWSSRVLSMNYPPQCDLEHVLRSAYNFCQLSKRRGGEWRSFFGILAFTEEKRSSMLFDLTS